MSLRYLGATIVALGTLSALVIPASTVQAVTTIYTSQASYLTALAGYRTYTETFAGTAGDGNTAISFTGNGLAYTVTSPPNNVFRNEIIGSNFEATPVIFTSNSGNINAIGGNFYLTDIAGVFVSGLIQISLSDGTTASYTSTSTNDFRGFISTTPLSTLTLGNSVPGTYNTADNVTVAVPEPGSVALLGLGLLPLVGVVARRRGNKNA